MFRLTLIPPDTKIPFVRMRFFFFAWSTFLVVSSVLLLAVRGLNLGIDFRGGILIEVKAGGPIEVAAMRKTVSELSLGEVELQGIGNGTEVLLRLPMQEGSEGAQQAAVEAVKTALGAGYEYRRTEIVGPRVSDELFHDGLAALALALGGILAYVWFRFEWQFAVCGVVALLHDVLSTIGLFALLGWEFNLATVAAVLTIAGYSINDTVVIYDRVRENFRKYRSIPLPEMLNRSLNETLTRTSLTSFTTLLAVFSLFIFGGEVIRGFSLAMIWGIVIGTYSSIAIATPLLLYMRLPRLNDRQRERVPVGRRRE